MIVYHYTTKSALLRIIQSGRLSPSYFSTALDAVAGEGWYFTDLPPSRSNQELYQLWGQAVPGRTRCYLAFDIDPEFLEETRPHVYRLGLELVEDKLLSLTTKYHYGETIVIRFRRHGYR